MNNFPSMRIEGNIIAADIIEKLETSEIRGQKPADFGLPGDTKVKDEIARAWADAQDQWRIFNRKLSTLKESSSATSETRSLWVVPLLTMLGYQIERAERGEIVNEKNYPISHRITARDGFPVHIMGYRDSLDKKREDSGPRMSPHALMQEYLNLTEHLYGIVTNGQQIRLLRDSSRLVKLSFLEFDLERIFQENLYADFAVLYRLLHATRTPARLDSAAESIIEHYHQDSLESGTRIRDGLSKAVKNAILSLSNGFLNHPDNQQLRDSITSGSILPKDFYLWHLRLIYRLLFLMVIEERDLIFPKGTPRSKREIYYKYYSVLRLRKLAERRHLADKRHQDAWASLKSTLVLFEAGGLGSKLGVSPLAGDLFSSDAIGSLGNASLDNQTLLACLNSLSTFENPDTHQRIRVNYGALNVEEFGSVYEGLLEYNPQISDINGRLDFSFVTGDERSATGSHYTPDELVQPLIKHSLDYIIEEKLKEKEKEKALLSIRVCDVACGSGHILLNAARRIATELAVVRTGEDQPSPSAFRVAVRDTIRNCIYGVDINPLAVELCKVALWLEAHNPGEPLNFLDYHIKCGNAIVGLSHKEELECGIPTEAFSTLPGDDKEIATSLRNRNKQEVKTRGQMAFNFEQSVGKDLNAVIAKLDEVVKMPEHTPEEISAKQKAYKNLQDSHELRDIRICADIQVAQFFIPKTEDNNHKIITEQEYWQFLRGEKALQGQSVAKAMATAIDKRFFHWFLEFPEIMNKGGFDCILGNPPFLGGQKLSGTYGNNFCEYIQFQYSPIGSVDLVTYFFRRIFTIIKDKGFQALISTNTIAQGDARSGGLAVINEKGGTINFAIRSMKWPGLAAVVVSLIAIHKGKWTEKFILDNKKVNQITAYLDDAECLGDPYKLKQNENKSFQGSIVLGSGFILTPDNAQELINKNHKNKDVLFPYLNGDDLNNNIEQSPSRWVINFFDWDEDYCRKYYPECFEIVERLVKPERMEQNDKGGKEFWWRFLRMRGELYSTIGHLGRVLVIAQVSKTVAFVFVPSNQVISMMCIVLAYDDNFHLSILQNTIHKEWVYKYASALKSDIRYTPSDVFETFPFPKSISIESESKFEKIGEKYHESRHQLMQKIQLGLTKTYNQFHNRELRKFTDDELANLANLTPNEFQKKYGKENYNLWNHLNKTSGTCPFNDAVADILKLRELHKQMDEAVLEAYGWHQPSEAGPAIALRHDFYEVEYLPESDRVRYTIHPEARKEVLKRLLLLNHKIHAEEVAQGLHSKKPTAKSKMKKSAPTSDNIQETLNLDENLKLFKGEL